MEFEKAGELRICDFRVVPEIGRCCFINVFIDCPFPDIWNGVSKYFKVVFLISFVNVCL
jgi:hypothetical protein